MGAPLVVWQVFWRRSRPLRFYSLVMTGSTMGLRLVALKR